MSVFNETHIKRLKVVAIGFTVFTGLISLLTIVGWTLEGDILLELLPGATSAMPMSAVALIAGAMSLLLFMNCISPLARIIACGLSTVVLLFGILGVTVNLWEGGLHVSDWLNQMLIPGAVEPPGRKMSPTTAGSLICLGIALLLMNVRSRRVATVVVWLCLPPLLSSLIVLIGYGYGVRGFYRVGYYTAMTLPAALGVLGLVLGIFCARPERKPARFIVVDNFGGFAARRLVVAALIIPPFLGWWRLLGEQRGLYGPEFGVALFTLSTMLILTTVVLFVTERLGLLDERLRLEVKRFETLANMIPEFAWSASSAGEVDYFNDRWYEYTGMQPRKAEETNWGDFIHPDDWNETLQLWNQAVATGKTFETYHRVRSRDGAYRWFVARAVPIREVDGAIARWFGTSTDIEDKQRKGEQLEIEVADRTAVAEERSDQIRQLAMELTEAEQRERSRLARVLHDDLQQLLVGVKMKISRLGQHQISAADDSSIEGLLSQAIETSRTLSKELAPPILYHQGLGSALNWLADSSRDRYGLNVKVQTHELGEPESHWLRLFLFEVVRELLLNVAKHSGAEKVRIDLTRANDVIGILVEDFGKGFSVKNRKASTGSGLYFIQHRIALIGGTMKIDSAPGKGTRVHITVPLTGSAEENDSLVSD